MKIVTILGTRPEIIRLSIVIEKLDSLCSHILVHTGQNFDPLLSDLFFAQLGVRKPDHFLNVRGDTFGEQIGRIIAAGEKVLGAEKPDRLLILGDTNSGLAAIGAKRMGIPVYHMEAGNRCYDDRVPEETNRRIIDHSSDVLMPYTERSRMNLLREGIAGERIYVTGNPILEVLDRHAARIEASTALDALGVKPAGYFLVTMHRAENVDIEERLKNLTLALDRVQREFGKPVIVSTHPRTKAQIQKNRILMNNPEVRFLEPFGLFDFVALEMNACCVLSDSGTVQEECCIFKVPNVTIRDVTERPETIECGSNILSGANPETIIRCVRTAMSRPADWDPPREYLVKDVSSTVIRILTGYHWKQR
jgi:UDP-N-acetylglucosamine 2-epimerase (non-hydrolysing)